MNKLFTILIALISLSVFAFDADAASRMGGGRNIGKQRSDINQQQAAPKAPAQQQKQAAPAAPAQQPSGMSRWLGPLAGLALGAGLMALFMNNGIAGALGGILMIVAIIAVAVFLVRLFLRGRTAQQPLQYAAAGAEPTISPTISALPGGAGAQSVAATTNASTSQWPAGFDAVEFVRHAKLNFVRLQDAYDKRELATMRDFLTPEVYREIEADIQAAGAAPQKTDVVTLDAEVLDVSTENNLYVVSVRFSGLIREKEGGGLEPFSEIWHLQKPVSGRSGWLIAGIQQA